MPSQYDETNPRNANSGSRRNNPNSSNPDRDVRGQFNFQVELGQRFAELSPDGKKNVEILARHGTDRLEREISDQKRSHSYRKVVEENRRLKEVLRNPELKLGDIKFDGPNEIKHIEETARETVSRREESYREAIREEVRYSIEREMAEDRNRREFGPDYRSPQQDHDPYNDPEH